MSVKLNLIKREFGRLTVIEFKGVDKFNKTLWLCKCSCGNTKVIQGGHLTSKQSNSCGCLNREAILKKVTTHGFRYTQFYRIWLNMKNRCNNKNDNNYKYYGGRGIIHDPKWNNFKNFFKDMYFKYLYAIKQLGVKKPSIERLNVNDNYCFENCCFIERKDQSKNRRDYKFWERGN